MSIDSSTSDSSILGRQIYGIGEAARLLGLRTDLARGWLDGHQHKGVTYKPVIRPEPTGDKIVTWGEFVTLGYLREYRRKRVPLQRLRPVITELRSAFETPYPLATMRPYVYDKELVLEVQERTGVPTSIAVVIRSGQEIMLTPETNRFFNKVEFSADRPGAALRLRPAGPASPVVIDPLMRFGRPNVDGIATERLWELHDAGESLEQIARGYEMALHKVQATVAYEEQFLARTA